jgi:sulfate adenylyltransferase
MADLIAPHGGVAELVERMIPAAEVAEVQARLAGRPQIPLSDADLSTLYRIGDGGLSPLTGPMTQDVWDRVLDEEIIIGPDGNRYAWSIPLAFPVAEDLLPTLLAQASAPVGLVNSAGTLVGEIALIGAYKWDKKKYLHRVYGTERTDHPGARMVLSDEREWLISGTVRVLPAPPHPEYGDLVLSPRQTRALFAQTGYQRVVAFQTRNPLHRAHEYALVLGLEKLTRAGHFAGAVLNPLVGETKGDDVDAATRMRTYRALVQNRALGDGDTDEALWQQVGARFSDRLHLLGLDIKMFYAGPKEAVMHAIYRQNFGFTDIIIGRKHADAPYDDGTDIWDGLAAQRKFDELNGQLLIQPVKVGFAAFYAEINRVGLVEEHASKGWKPVSISGRDLREKLKAGELPDPRVMRPETARVLIEKYRA